MPNDTASKESITMTGIATVYAAGFPCCVSLAHRCFKFLPNLSSAAMADLTSTHKGTLLI